MLRTRSRPPAAGPVEVDPGVAELVGALDPATLCDNEFDGLLAAAGLTGGAGDGLALPERMAEVNALLDLASPGLREACCSRSWTASPPHSRVVQALGWRP